MEETGENHGPAASRWQTLSHNVIIYRVHNVSGDRHWLHIGSYKSNCHTTKMAPLFIENIACDDDKIFNETCSCQCF